MSKLKKWQETFACNTMTLNDYKKITWRWEVLVKLASPYRYEGVAVSGTVNSFHYIML